MMRRALAIAAALVAGVALATPAVGVAGKSAKVKVEDDFFSPSTLKVKKNAKVSFKWNDDNLNTHNVTLKKGPKGVKTVQEAVREGQDHEVQRLGQRVEGDQLRPDLQQERDLQLHLHDSPGRDEDQGHRQEVDGVGS